MDEVTKDLHFREQFLKAETKSLQEPEEGSEENPCNKCTRDCSDRCQYLES